MQYNKNMLVPSNFQVDYCTILY